jgi:uncharacterized protein involved in exopolysaccharide biosynthesis
MDHIKHQPANNTSDEISLKDLIFKIKSYANHMAAKRNIIIITGIIGALIGLGYSFLKRPVYLANLSFALQDEKSSGGLSGALGLASQFGLDLGGGGAGGEFSGDNLLALMKSRSLIEKALLMPVMVKDRKITLAEFYIDFNKFREDWKGKPEEKIQFLPDANRSAYTITQDSLLGVFYKDLLNNNVSVEKADKKLSIISISVASKNELFSKYFAEVLAKVVSDYYIQTKTEKASKNVSILQKQTDSVRRTLNAAIGGVASSLDAAPNANPALQVLHVPSQRKQVDVQANTAILSELVKNLELSKMSLLQATPLIQVIDKPILPLEKEKVGKLKGSVIGAFIGAFLAILFLTIKRIFNAVMS